MSSDPTVFIIDDDEDIRDSLRWLVESVGLKAEVFAVASDYLSGGKTGRAGCLLLDVRLPGMSGLDLQEHLNSTGDSLPVVFMSAFGDVPTVVRAMKAGAVDFIEKPFSGQAMLDLIHHCFDIDAERRRERHRRVELRAAIARLTEREREVMDLVIEGKTNKQIARRLEIVPKTVEAHRARMMEKMRVRSVAELVRATIDATGRIA